MKMKAYVISEPNKHGLAEVDVPTIGPDEVLMKTLASGICHSNIFFRFISRLSLVMSIALK